MPPLIRQTLVLKNRAELERAIARMSVAAGTIPADQANRAVFSIAARAGARMPVTDPSRITNELQAAKAVELVKLKSGRFSRAKKNTKNFFNGSAGEAPLLTLIVSARANPNSHFNQITNSRYALPHSPWQGVDRATGAQRMLETMRAMFNSRIRSSGFFRTSAKVVMFLFKRQVPSQVATGGAASAIGSISKRIGKIAGGQPATPGNPTATFWVSSTSAETDGGLFKVAQPVWQEALDYEREFLMAKAAELEYKDALKALGFKVT